MTEYRCHTMANSRYALKNPIFTSHVNSTVLDIFLVIAMRGKNLSHLDSTSYVRRGERGDGRRSGKRQKLPSHVKLTLSIGS
jgi:hypothetical protein